MASPSDPPAGHAGDTEQFPVARTGANTAQPRDAAPTGGPAHAVSTDSGSGITRGSWWAITIAAAVLLILGFLLTFGPARYWTPVPVAFLGYFLISGLIGLVFWKGVSELRDSNPTLHSGDGPASPGTRVAAAMCAVGIASALILLPAGLIDAPAGAAPCPDGTNTCGPQPTMGPQPTQGNGGNTTAPQAPNTTVPGYTAPDTPPQQGNGSTPTVQGQVPTMPTGDTPSNGCIFNCGPTQAPQQAPQTGQATPPQTGQNPVTTAPNTPATTPQAPTTTPRLRTPTPETTTSTTSSKARDRDDDQQRSGDEDREKNSGIPYQAAEIAALAGTYRRKKTSDAIRDGQVVSESVTRTLTKDVTDQPILVTHDQTITVDSIGDPFGRSAYPKEADMGLALNALRFGRIPNEGLKNKAEATALSAKAGEIFGFQTPSSQGLYHYLTRSGDDFVIHGKDMDKITSTDGYQNRIRNLLGEQARLIASNTDLKPGQSVTRYFKSDWNVVSNPGDVLPEGYYNLLGDYSDMIMGKMTVSKSSSGTLSWNADYATSIYDAYDFDPAKPAPGPLRALGVTLKDLDDMVGAGYAQNFRTVGTSGVSSAIGFS